MTKSRNGLSQEGLKLIAAAAMLIDHVGLALCGDNFLMRCVGRLALPIYAFLLVEGFLYTSNYLRYLGRLALFALLSEVPFDLMVFGVLTDPMGQNVMLTLLLGLVCLWFLELAENLPLLFRVLASGFSIVILGLMADGTGSDYGAFGIWLTALFYFTHDLPRWQYLIQAGGIVFLCLLQYGSLTATPEPLAALAVPILAMYRGERLTRGKAVQYCFYAFYPAHMLIIGLLANLGVGIR